MWAMIAGVAVILAQAAQPGPGSKGHEWCFDRGPGTQLCEATEAASTTCGRSTPKSHRARADVLHRRKSNNRRPNRLRPRTRRSKRQLNDSPRRLQHREGEYEPVR